MWVCATPADKRYATNWLQTCARVCVGVWLTLRSADCGVSAPRLDTVSQQRRHLPATSWWSPPQWRTTTWSGDRSLEHKMVSSMTWKTTPANMWCIFNKYERKLRHTAGLSDSNVKTISLPPYGTVPKCWESSDSETSLRSQGLPNKHPTSNTVEAAGVSTGNSLSIKIHKEVISDLTEEDRWNNLADASRSPGPPSAQIRDHPWKSRVKGWKMTQQNKNGLHFTAPFFLNCRGNRNDPAK